MSDDLQLADGFVRAVLEDNARLRAENADITRQLAEAKEAASKERNRLLWHIYQMTEKLGGEVTFDGSYLNLPTARLHVDHDWGNGYRLVPVTEVVPNGEVLSPDELREAVN